MQSADVSLNVMTIQNDMSQKDREHKGDTRTPRGKKINKNKNRLENAQWQIKKLKIMYTNCDTLGNKFEELEIAVKI